MDIFVRQGFSAYVLAAGFREELIEQFMGELSPGWVVEAFALWDATWDDTGRVQEFLEKPRLLDHWISAGFIVVSAEAFDQWKVGTWSAGSRRRPLRQANSSPALTAGSGARSIPTMTRSS